MKSFFLILAVLCLSTRISTADINATDLNLTDEQNQKLTELKIRLNEEINPIWEEIESSKNRIREIEKHYFEEFWNMLTQEQQQKFSEIQANANKD